MKDHRTTASRVIALDDHRPGFTTHRIEAALAGRLDAMLLSADERDLFDDQLGQALDTISTPTERAFLARFTRQTNDERGIP